MTHQKKQNATGIILAGGKGSRINRNKALITLPDGNTFIQRCLDTLEKVFQEILIVTNEKELYGDYEARVVEDLIKQTGPLGGIFTGLCHSTSYFNFVTGCDMPFPQIGLIELLVDRCRDRDVAIPEIGGEVEPLFAVYSKNCLPVVFDHLQKRDFKIRHVLTELKVEKIGEKEIDIVDPEHLSFLNINTDKDLKKALLLMDQMSKSK
jgi:molybdopterin-guanine dinucleotide biosynthesis protein A